ncbi:AlkA N-terminal domain-containing protein [Luethyella okanaganae]|uniref:DNA-3-methyladenine glycosylase II n=1 Tax=Luethyella okanaganae TaxID=69372 RepID=A0ABW1VHL5_9MICO
MTIAPVLSPARSRPAAPRNPLADPVFAERYRAMSSRDVRFDGQFITGVHSTGIYCRPSCPATTPKPSNVSFYLTAAAAHEAGLRACKRCLPDAVPGSPEWNVRDDLAARAMRLIADGTVERDGVPGLAARLGYTPRHLTRVLQSELGAGPLALARAHRAQTARVLLTSTELPITDIAFAAGFGSVRQFNETIVTVYEQTPTALRARGTTGGTTFAATVESHGATTVRLRLPARAPFDGAGVLGFLAARAVDGVETFHDGTYRRALRLPHGAAIVALRAAGSAETPIVECEASLADLSDLAPLVTRVRRLLDLDADAAAIDAVLGRDPTLARSVAETPGIRVPGSVDPQETLFRALVGQQVSVAGARTVLGRLADALGDRMPRERGGWTLFPTPEQIAAGGREVLRGPAARIETIVAVAEALSTGALRLTVGETREELTDSLTALSGIGPWTAGYVSMRVLGSPDILLTSDLALRQGAAKLGFPGEAKALEKLGSVWAPWRSYAGMHLWRAAGA